MKQTKRQEKFLSEIIKNYTQPDNIFPKPMTDREALEMLCNYFLGEDWYTVNPVNHNQVNVYRVVRIIECNRIK